MGRLVQSKQRKTSGVYDPKVDYKWEPDDVFEITGQQFASLYHTLTQELRNVGGASLILKHEAYQVVMDIFKIGVEQGVILERDVITAEDVEQLDSNVESLFKKVNPKANGKEV